MLLPLPRAFPKERIHTLEPARGSLQGVSKKKECTLISFWCDELQNAIKNLDGESEPVGDAILC